MASPSQTQTAEQRTDRRRTEILEAAFDCFAKTGFRETTVADIAKRLRIGHGTIYRYFENKHQIFDQVVQVVIERIATALAGEAPDATSDLPGYRAQVQRIAEKLIDLLDSDPRATKILFIEASGVSPELNQKMQGMWTLLGQVTEAYLVNGKQKGFLRQDLDTTVTALAINAMIFEGGRQMVLAKQDESARARWIRGVMAMMFNGIRAER
jgi:AcrR family transcriptional regulator